MKISRKSLILIAVIFLGLAIALPYMWHTNRGPFRGNSISGLPNAHIRVIDTQPSHLDLLFHRYGGVDFNYFGEQVSVNIARYARDELVLHERVANISTVGDYELSGFVLWGITMEENMPRELRVRLNMGGGTSQSYIDFSPFHLEFKATSGPAIPNSPIERGQQYALQTWQTGSTMRIPQFGVADVFDPEILKESEYTVILYMVFE